VNIDQTQRLITHMYCAAMAGAQIQPLNPQVCPAWEADEQGRNRYVPVLIWGEAGVGKSETVKWVANHLGIGFIDLRLGQLDAGDLLGLPDKAWVYPCVYDHMEGASPDVLAKRFSEEHLLRHILETHPDRSKGKTGAQIVKEAIDLAQRDYRHLISKRLVYATPSWFPAPGTHGILFLDEISRSHPDIQNAVFQLILDRKILTLDLPDGWIIVGANNPAGRDYEGVSESNDKAFRSRFLHIALDPTWEEWLEYAYATGIDPSIRSLVRSSKTPDEILGLSPVPMLDSFPTPRTWVMLNNLMDGLDRDLVLEVAQGLVGPEAAAAWAALRQIPTDPVTGEDIVEGYVVRADGSQAPTTIRDKVFSFLDFPVPLYDEEGRPQMGPDGKQMMERSKRDDVIALTFDDLTEIVERPSLQPYQLTNLVAFLEDAFRPEEESGTLSDVPTLPARSGLGVKALAYQYLKFWTGAPSMGQVLDRTVGLLRKALEEAGEAAKVAQARRGRTRRRRRRPGSSFGELFPEMAAFQLQDW
jgi:hypothetical protein